MTGYDRDQFGQEWLDADRNGCDTRNDILGRDLVGVRTKPGTGGCKVLRGVLHDPYTGALIRFTDGDDLIDIDHVVALGDAWATGAARWPLTERAAFANDPLNLLAVDMHANRQKGDADAATWLPPVRSYRCAYVARLVTIKTKYALWATPAEAAAMRRVLATCRRQPATADPTHAPIHVDQHVSVPGHGSGSGDASATGPRGFVGGGGVHYANCDAVRAAGKAPLHRGQPGYSRELDRDGDGIACED